MHPLDAFFLPPDDDAAQPSHRHALSGSPALLAALEHVSDAVFALDRDWRFAYLNTHAETLLKRSRMALLGTIGWEAFPEVVGTLFEREYRRAMDQGTSVAFEAQYPGTTKWFSVRACLSPAGLVIYAQDIPGARRSRPRSASRSTCSTRSRSR